MPTRKIWMMGCAAQRRVELQTQLLTKPAWGCSTRSGVPSAGTTAEDAAEADNLIFTHLPSLLAEKYQANGQTDRHELVTQTWNQLVPEKRLATPPATVLSEALKSQQANQYQQAAQFVKEWKGPPAEQDLLAMQAVCQAAAAGQYAPALALTTRLADPVLKEECYPLIMGSPVARGNPPEAHLPRSAPVKSAGPRIAAGQAVRARRSSQGNKS
jgi:hypothetical protein